MTLLLDHGATPHKVQQIAGHSGIEVTTNVDAHAPLDETRRGLNKLRDSLGR